jgi:hypothetical protein
VAAFLLGGRAAELPGEVGAYSNGRLAVDISINRYKPPLVKAVVVKLDYLVDRGVPGLSSKTERGSISDQSRDFRSQQGSPRPLRNSGRRSDRITDLG